MKHLVWLLPLLLLGCTRVGTVYEGVESVCLRTERIDSTGITTSGHISFGSGTICMERAYYYVVKRYEGWLQWAYLEKKRCKETLCEGERP